MTLDQMKPTYLSHPSFRTGWRDAVQGRKQPRKFRSLKRQREYNKGWSLGTHAKRYALAEYIAGSRLMVTQ